MATAASVSGTQTRARPKVGLVLGGGGYPGMAFHAGTLLALEVDFGWDPRSASVVVGTSAGSLVGAMLRAGLSTDDLAAWCSGAPPLTTGEHFREAVERAAQIGLRPWRPGLGSTLNPWSVLRSAASFGLLDNTPAIAALSTLLDDWPEDPLLITASTGRRKRVVFGSHHQPPIWRAIAASCAIPVVFPPVLIDGQRCVDGGLSSPTNADVLLDQGVDVAIVVSPMTGATSCRQLRPDLLLRTHARRLLKSEVAKLRSANIETFVFEPDESTVNASRWNVLRTSGMEDVARGAFLSATKAVDMVAFAMSCGRVPTSTG